MFSSLHTSVGFAVVGAVVGEYLGSAAGLGYLIQQAEGVFDVAGVFAGMFVLSAFVILIDMGVTLVERRLLIWRPAAAALVPVIPPTEASAKMSGAKSTKSPDEKLEKELSEIDQKWMDAVRTTQLDYLKQMYAEKWFEILGWIPTVVLTKPAALARVAKLNYKPGEGLFADQFKLMAVYGDAALATDRRIRKLTDASGSLVSTPHRALLVFVKENGQWKVAADAAVPMMATE